MRPSSRFLLNAPDVIQETLDGEAVIVNLVSGSYYSLDGAGADVLSMVERGASAEEIAAGVRARYAGEPEAIARGVEELLLELEREGLIVVADGVVAGPAPAPGDPAPGGAGPFRAPVLRKYTDMQQLLLMDPIHEVDASGWPNSRTDPADGEPERR